MQALEHKVETYRIKDIFYVTSGVRITHEDIYHNPGSLPCVTSQTVDEGIAWLGDEEWLGSITKNGRPVIIDQPCVTWTKDGVKAGTLFYRDYRFYPNDHSGVLIPKGEIEINLKWFVYNFQEYIYSKVHAQKSQGMIYEEQMENIEIKVPHIDIQNKIADEYEITKTNKKIIQDSISKLNNQLKRNINFDGDEYLIGDIFDFKGGNSGLTQEFIYQNTTNTDEGMVKVYSGALDQSNMLGYITKYAKINGKPLKVFDGPCIITVRKGLAGSMLYVDNETFTINDDAYAMFLKRDWINNVDLNWFIYQYQDMFREIATSKSDNATLSKEYIKRKKIIIPPYEEQLKILEQYNQLEVLIEQLKLAL